MTTQPVPIHDSRIQRHLVQRESQRQKLRNQLIAGAVSYATATVTPAYFHALRERILATRFQRKS